MIGGLASLVPLAFLSLCAWVTCLLPKRLRKGDTVFLDTFCLLAVPLPSWGTLPRAGAPAAEPRLGSCAGNSRLGFRTVRLSNSGRDLHSPWCIYVAMGRAPGKPSGCRHAHKSVVYSLPGGAADESCGRRDGWELACPRVLGNDVCFPRRLGVESPSLRPPLPEAPFNSACVTTKLEEVPSVDC